MQKKIIGFALAAPESGKCFVCCLILCMAVIFASVLCVSEALAQDATSCINNTQNEGQCKDCCDCLDGDAVVRTTCRNTCATHDFSANTSFITVTAPSTLGPNGDYSVALAGGGEAACKLYCDGSSALSCGDRRYCRDQCNATYFTDPGTAPTDPSSGGGISITQAVSDEAQANTIAFDGMAFLTGDLCSNTFLPPGKVADFSGFQYFRDTDPTALGHNTNFVTIIAYNILNILTETQRAALINLAKNQITQISNYGYGRLPLVKAFVRMLNGDIPTGSSGLLRNRVMAYSADLYELDGQISYDRAKTLGTIIREMTAEQKAKIDALKALNGIGNWDNTMTDPLSSLKLEPALSVAVMTYASEMYSWYAGDVEADTYFCPERQATYFGSFYMKDAPAMAGVNVTISDSLTANVGTDFLNVLDTTQRALVTSLVDTQRSDLYEIVSTRRLISTQLRRFITESSVDSATVLNLARRYGELDGAIVYNYANNFVQVSKTMTDAQKAQLLPILVKYDWGRIACTGGYLYSEKLSALPDIEGIKATDYFFTTDTTASPYAWFGFSPSAPTASEMVTFTDYSSGNPTSWSWDFGDGTISTSQNPTHTFTGANSNTVTLTATNTNGYGTASRTITVTSGNSGVVTAGTISKIAEGTAFTFTEGPAADASGNVFFSDITANKIYKWSTDGQLSTFLANSGGANGLFFDKSGNLIACQGTDGKLVSIDSQSNVTILAEKYNNVRFNEPNDLWVDPSGGVYFSDPLYFGNTLYQGGEHVYYLKPDGVTVIRVISDMVRPNGLVGTSDGKTLYVADHGAGKTYKYSINTDGTLSGKTLFASSGSDGMTIDSQGNVYLTAGTTVLVYSSSGAIIETINVPLQPTNVSFGGRDGKTLFITAKTAVYSLLMKVKGISPGPIVLITGPSATITKSGPVAYTVNYTGADAINLTADNVTLNKTGTANGTISVESTGISARTVTVANITGDGTLGISIAAGTASSTTGSTAFGSGPSNTFVADNTLPVVSAGENQTKNILFTQIGTAVDVSAMTYIWAKQSGTGALTFGSPTALSTTISANENGTYVIRFTATDTAGNSSFSDMTLVWDTITKSIAGDINGDGNVDLADAILALKIINGLSFTETINLGADVNGDRKIGMAEILYIFQTLSKLRQGEQAPVANAGTAQSVVTGAIVTLDGSGSSDANGDSLTYSWSFTSKPNASNATLSSATSVRPTFIPDVAGTYVLSLVVNDGKVNSAAATVTVTASVANAAPVANAGTAQSVVAGTLVTLDGSGSSDANGDSLTYSWAFTSKPAGSSATLSNPTAAKPTFTADVDGTYVISLVVNDGKINSVTATVSILSTANSGSVTVKW